MTPVRAAGDAYDRAFGALNRHVYACERCAWLGDGCVQREVLINAFNAARAGWVRARQLTVGFRARVRFHAVHGGGVVGAHWTGAYRAACAEVHAIEAGWRCTWETDDVGLEDHDEWCLRTQAAARLGRRISSCEHETYVCVLRDTDGTPLASLCAIIDPSDDYRRVVEAELALEAMDRASEAATSAAAV